MIRRAKIYERSDEYIFSGSSRVKDGFWVGNGWAKIIRSDATDVEVGESLIEALCATEDGLPNPSLSGKMSPSFKSLMKMVSAKSMKEFYRNIREVSARQEEGTLTITPNRHDGPKKAIFYLPNEKIVTDSRQPAELGVALRQALERAPVNVEQ